MKVFILDRAKASRDIEHKLFRKGFKNIPTEDLLEESVLKDSVQILSLNEYIKRVNEEEFDSSVYVRFVEESYKTISSMPKIYLSTSRAANEEYAKKHKTFVNSINGVEIVEWKSNGKPYTSDLLMSCDCLIIIPPTAGNFNIGKGQYNEIIQFLKKGNVFMVYEGEYYPITGLKEVTDDQNWQDNFGRVDVSLESLTKSELEELLTR